MISIGILVLISPPFLKFFSFISRSVHSGNAPYANKMRHFNNEEWGFLGRETKMKKSRWLPSEKDFPPLEASYKKSHLKGRKYGVAFRDTPSGDHGENFQEMK